jgi:hypothetical protein
MFKKKKPEAEKEKEVSKDDKKTEKQLDELIQSSSSDQNTTSKSHSSSFYLDNIEVERRILSEILKEDMNDVDPSKLYDKFVVKIKNWNYSKFKDEHRPYYASKNGGIDFPNKELTSLLRSTGVDLIKQIGKKIIAGDFNLTTISFPIKVMLPITILQSIALSYFQFPCYLNLASLTPDPLERFKYIVVSTLACFHKSSHFLKPMNPVLGETYEMLWEDGSKIYLEQSSHHPPISHFYMLGPKKNFKYYGFGNFGAGAGFNSVKVYNKGKRTVEFADGGKIQFNFCNEEYGNSFFGVIKQESIGELQFKDVVHGFELVIKLGNVKKKPSDYFQGEIKLKNIVVSKIYGSYLSFIEFNNIRYWDIRENIEIKSLNVEKQLLSSSIYREDRILLGENKVEEAQKMKERIEDLQRYDRKLRQKIEKK